MANNGISYRLVSKVVNKAMEKGMASLLYYDISSRFAIKWFSVEIIGLRGWG